MGLKPGESVERICQIRVVDVRREPLDAMDDIGGTYGDAEAVREGFPHMTGAEFVHMFVGHMGGPRDQDVTRIEFEYMDAEVPS